MGKKLGKDYWKSMLAWCERDSVLRLCYYRFQTVLHPMAHSQEWKKKDDAVCWQHLMYRTVGAVLKNKEGHQILEERFLQHLFSSENIICLIINM